MHKCNQLLHALVIVFDVVRITMLRVALLMVGLSVHHRLENAYIQRQSMHSTSTELQ